MKNLGHVLMGAKVLHQLGMGAVEIAVPVPDEEGLSVGVVVSVSTEGDYKEHEVRVLVQLKDRPQIRVEGYVDVCKDVFRPKF